ncbi:DNA processing protein [Paraburkholderia sp. HC6.4b]|uniref:DNA-processing protein DprA n=1 Tax=unclassified Paraburkholderia TaxID=2615204 RepID=UPI0016206F4B|nr:MULTISPECIES: DNA-processing protein DprA [unclassified Paraburkholderia]MBB5408971.1 DNA processing protein [Paraburkholderia sp. HC6.4b]MBB5450699.1 DNA processing protein [Paraburkholderia sp. Kb1A]
MQTLPATRIELAAWLRLSLAPGLKPAALRLLLGAFGLPQALLAQSPETLVEVAGDAAARAVLAPPGPAFDGQLDAVLAWREQPGNQIVTLDDPAYPPALLTIPDPPPLLYIKGRLDLLHTRAVALVGSRSATPQGIEDARRFARELSAAGVTVVSGLALGIDGAAHRGGLEGAGGTVAVVGTGADLVYPAAHQALARQIAAQGAILSEWPLGTPARAANFPQRNRLIAGLVSGVVIVEAAMRSGSLITARLANEMGRDVFALPGSIYAPLSRGCHRMIKQGARLVETPDEVLEELGFARRPAGDARRSAKRAVPLEHAGLHVSSGGTALPATTAAFADSPASGPAPQPALAPDAQRLLAALGHSPTTLEILAARTEMENAALHAALLRLELAGEVTLLPGGRFMRAHHD